MLDLDHVGAVVAEEHRGQRSRKERRRLDDPDPSSGCGHEVHREAEADPVDRARPPPSSRSLSE